LLSYRFKNKKIPYIDHPNCKTSESPCTNGYVKIVLSAGEHFSMLAALVMLADNSPKIIGTTIFFSIPDYIHLEKTIELQ
jgi:hypothetical protein